MAPQIPIVTLHRAAVLSRDGKPWRVRLVTRPGTVTKTGAARDAFWEATGGRRKGSRLVEIRYGRTGSAGQTNHTTPDKAIQKAGEKLGGDYQYHGEAALDQPVMAQPKAQRVITLRERLAECTMRPTTMAEVWQRIADHGLVKMQLDADFREVYRGCEAMVMYQATKAGRQGMLYAVVRYPGGELLWGSPRSD